MVMPLTFLATSRSIPCNKIQCQCKWTWIMKTGQHHVISIPQELRVLISSNLHLSLPNRLFCMPLYIKNIRTLLSTIVYVHIISIAWYSVVTCSFFFPNTVSWKLTGKKEYENQQLFTLHSKQL